VSAGERWRMVNCQDGRRHVSSVVLSAEEAYDHIVIEREMHEASGWDVVLAEPDRLLVQKNRDDGCLVKREIVVERFSPNEVPRSRRT
jgi:hypothetical protein